MSTQSLLVAGTAGGAGTTTVAALIIALLRSRGIPTAACDHSGGTLGQRIAPDEPAAQGPAGSEMQVTDAGRMEAAIADALEVPEFALCLVSGPGIAAAQATRAAVDGLLERFGQQIRRRVLVVVCTSAAMRRRDEQLAREILRPDIELPRSPVLGSTGPIRLDLADKALASALDRLGGLLAGFVRVPTAPQDEDWPTRITRMPEPAGAEPATPQSPVAAADSPPTPAGISAPEPAEATATGPGDRVVAPRTLAAMAAVPDGPPEPAPRSAAPPAQAPMAVVPDSPPEPTATGPLPARGAPPDPTPLTAAPTRGIAPEPDEPLEPEDAAPARAARRAPEDPGEQDEPVPTGQERARRGDVLG